MSTAAAAELSAPMRRPPIRMADKMRPFAVLRAIFSMFAARMPTIAIWIPSVAPRIAAISGSAATAADAAIIIIAGTVTKLNGAISAPGHPASFQPRNATTCTPVDPGRVS